MKRRRILGRPGACYHVISRFVDRQFAMGDEGAKRLFYRLMMNQAKFAGIEILTFCLMGNHFHILLRIPEAPDLPEAEVLRRLGLIWNEKRLKDYHQHLDRIREQSVIADQVIDAELDRHRRRMYDLSEFVKDLKQRFSILYNRSKGRKGTLFEERFKSVLVQDGQALRMMAAYIDLNPVRAGLVDDPVDYKWCGYSQAVGGNKDRRRGLRSVLTDPRDNRKPAWGEVAKRYRLWLFERGMETHHRDGLQKKKGFSRAQAIATWEAEGNLPITSLLRCKVRHFSDAVVFGTKEYIEMHIADHRETLGAHPKANEAAGDKMFSLKPLRGIKLE